MAKRHCQATTKRGKPCRSTSLIGEFCFAHQPKEVRDSHGFGGSQPGAGRPRVPRVSEVMRDWLEQHAETVLRPYVDAIEHACVVVTYEGVATVTDIADLGARIAAAEKLQDRVLGRPRQTVQHSGDQDVPVTVEFKLDEKAREAIAGALRGRPASS